MTDDEQLARFRVALSTGVLPRDLGQWVFAKLATGLPAPARRSRRDDFLRHAALLIGGSDWAKASEILGLVEEFSRYPGLLGAAWYREENPAHWVQLALLLDPDLPRSRKQILRLID